MAADIILVAGISGVGKTALCRRLAETYPAARHLVASSFVNGSQAVDQLALVWRIRSAALTHDGPSLVDGHLIVGGNKIPREAVAALAPKAIVVVTGAPRDIVGRRAADGSRARPVLSEDDIARAQDAELRWARELAQAISLPLCEVDGGDIQGFQSTILHLLGAC